MIWGRAASSIATAAVLTLAACGSRGVQPAEQRVAFGLFIAVTVGDLPAQVDVAEQRESLRNQEAEPGSELVRWLPLASIEHWVKGSSQRAALDADPASYFEVNWRLVGARNNDLYYILAYTAPSKSLQHSRDAPWGIEDVVVSTDNLGRPSVLITVDAAGSERVRELTGPHVGHPLAIVIDGRVYSAPVLQSPLGKHVMIIGNYTQDEARRIRDQLM